MKIGRAARPRGFMLLALAGALLVLGMLAWAFNPGPRWRVADTQQADGNVRFDGDPVPATDAEAMGDLLLGGTVLEWQGHGDLELLSPGYAVLAIAPGTVVTLPSPPPRWFARTSRALLAEGTLHFVSGPRFRGARLVVVTPARTFTATGPAFSITHDPATGTEVAVSGAGIDEFARTKARLLQGRPAR